MPEQLILPFEPEHGVIIRPEIVVIGDWMIDQWYNCESIALSAEAPVPVVKYNFPPIHHAGGAGNVSENLRAMGWKVRSVGQSDPHKTRDLYENVPIKKRYMYQGRQVFRVDEQDRITTPIDPEDLTEALDYASNHSLPVVIADYNKGAINDKVTEIIVKTICKANIPFYIHTKEHPFVSYGESKSLTYFYNQKEYDSIISFDHMPSVGDVVVTYGPKGAVLYPGRPGNKFQDICTPVPGLVRSTCGAGDVFMSAYITAKEKGHPNPLAIADAVAKKTVTECDYTCVARGRF